MHCDCISVSNKRCLFYFKAGEARGQVRTQGPGHAGMM